MSDLLMINPKQEKDKIVSFLKHTFVEQKMNHAVIGLSGGIDSTVSFSLLCEVLPVTRIIVAHLYYFKPVFTRVEQFVREKGIPSENIHVLSIKDAVDNIVDPRQLESTESGKVRLGNIAARTRMILLYDFAKKENALVCGTENKTEYELSYFTRFGDQASDIEPIEHLYKTQIYQLARYLAIPESIITQQPTAGLWHGQTDEKEFGFSYKEADQVLFLHLEKGRTIDAIEQQGYPHARQILQWRRKNWFKHQVPYTLSFHE